LSHVFNLFAELRVARRVLVRLREEKLSLPSKTWGGPRHGTIRWKMPNLSDIMRLLHNPIYAGAIALHALDEHEAEQAEARRQRQMQIEQADYEVEIARRRYEVVDPENRLVARELELQWEEALRRRDQLRRDAEERNRQTGRSLGVAELALVRQMATDLGRVWHASTTEMADRKALLRFLVNRVYLDGVREAGQIRITVEWHTGAHTSVIVPRPAVGAHAPRTPEAAVERIRALWPEHNYARIAEILNTEGFKTAKGLAFNHFSVGYVVRSRGWNRDEPTT
jgi:hypothetical protein